MSITTCLRLQSKSGFWNFLVEIFIISSVYRAVWCAPQVRNDALSTPKDPTSLTKVNLRAVQFNLAMSKKVQTMYTSFAYDMLEHANKFAKSSQSHLKSIDFTVTHKFKIASTNVNDLTKLVCEAFDFKRQTDEVANTFYLVSDDGAYVRKERDSMIQFFLQIASSMRVPSITWFADRVGEFEMEEEPLVIRLEPTIWHVARAFVDFMRAYQWQLIALVISRGLPGSKNFAKEMKNIRDEVNNPENVNYYEFTISQELYFTGDQKCDQKCENEYIDILEALYNSDDRIILFHGNNFDLAALLIVAKKRCVGKKEYLLKVFQKDYVWILSPSIASPVESTDRQNNVLPENIKIKDQLGHRALKVPGMFALTYLNNLNNFKRNSLLATEIWGRSIEGLMKYIKKKFPNSTETIRNKIRPSNLCKEDFPHWAWGGRLYHIMRNLKFRYGNEDIGFLQNGAINTTQMHVFNSKITYDRKMRANMHWYKVGIWSMSSTFGQNKSKLQIDGVIWPGNANKPPKGAPAKFLMKVATLKENPYVVYSKVQDDNTCSSTSVSCRILASNNLYGDDSDSLESPEEGSWTTPAYGSSPNPEQETTTTRVPVRNNSKPSQGNSSLYVQACCAGLTIDILNELSKDLNFQVDLFEVADAKWGGWTANGWNGLVKVLQDKDADMVMTSLKITPNRSKIIDFSVPFQETGISIAVTYREGGISATAFLEPYNIIVWSMTLVVSLITITVLVCLFETCQTWVHMGRSGEPYDYASWCVILVFSVHACGAALFIYEWLSPHGLDRSNVAQREHRFSLFRSLWLIWSMLFGAAVNADNPRGVASRFLANIWALFALVFLASYTANLAAFMISKEDFYDLKGINDWRLQSPTSHKPLFRFATIPSGATEETIKKNFPRMSEYMRNYKKSTVEEGIKALKAGEIEAFLYDANVLNFFASHDDGCNLRTVRNWYAMTGYAVGFPRKSRWLAKVDERILKYGKEGKLQRWQKFWLTGQCKVDSNLNNTNKTLGVKNFISAFILLLGGMLICILFLVMEHIFYRYMRPQLKDWDRYGCCGLVSISMGQLLSFEQSVNQTVDLVKHHKCSNPICETQLWKSRHETDLLRRQMNKLESSLHRKQAIIDRYKSDTNGKGLLAIGNEQDYEATAARIHEPTLAILSTSSNTVPSVHQYHKSASSNPSVTYLPKNFSCQHHDFNPGPNQPPRHFLPNSDVPISHTSTKDLRQSRSSDGKSKMHSRSNSIGHHRYDINPELLLDNAEILYDPPGPPVGSYDDPVLRRPLLDRQNPSEQSLSSQQIRSLLNYNPGPTPNTYIADNSPQKTSTNPQTNSSGSIQQNKPKHQSDVPGRPRSRKPSDTPPPPSYEMIEKESVL